MSAHHLALALAQAAARALRIDEEVQFLKGVEDGYQQGFELSVGMTYELGEAPADVEAKRQWAYDLGSYIGACLAVRPAEGKPQATVPKPCAVKQYTVVGTDPEGKSIVEHCRAASPSDAVQQIEQGDERWSGIAVFDGFLMDRLAGSPT